MVSESPRSGLGRGQSIYKTNFDGAVRAGYIELIGAVCGLM